MIGLKPSYSFRKCLILGLIICVFYFLPFSIYRLPNMFRPPVSLAATKFNISIPANNLGLIGHWTFDGKNMIGGTVHDSSGIGNFGSARNMSTSTMFDIGKYGQALRFDGIDDRVDIPPASSLHVSGNKITVSAWVYTRKDTGAAQMFVTKPVSATSHSDPYFAYSIHYINGSNYLRMCVATGSEASFSEANNCAITTGNIWSHNQWNHVVGTYDGASISIYVNGVLGGTKAKTNNLNEYTTPLRFGANGGSTEFFEGKLDDVRLYNRTLSADEITRMYREGLRGGRIGIASSGPQNRTQLLYWTFDGKDTVWTSQTAGTVSDSSGAGITGTMTSMDQFFNPAPGKIGQALRFDGLGDYVTGGNQASLDSLAAFTASFWIKPNEISRNSVAVFGKYRGAGEGYGMEIFNGGEVRLFNTTGAVTTNYQSASAALKAGVWQHVDVVFGGTSAYKLYVDGVSKSLSLTGAIDAATPTGSSRSFLVGLDNSADHNAFNGMIDDFHFYSQALSRDEIIQLNKLNISRIAVSSNDAVSNGLVGYWTFDGKDIQWTSPTGGNALDALGLYPGSILNVSQSTFTAPGKFGQAIKLDGVNDNVNMGTNLDFIVGTQSLSASFWIKPDDINRNDIGLFGKFGLTDGAGFGAVINSGGAIRLFNSTDIVSNYQQVSSAVTKNQWYHIVIIYDGTRATYRLFVNGIEQTLTTTGTVLSTLQGEGYEFTVGIDNQSGNYFKGLFDDFRLYTRVLSDREVGILYGMGR